MIVEQFAPVHVSLRAGKFLQAERQMVLVHVAQRDDVLRGERIKMRLAAAPVPMSARLSLLLGAFAPKI